MNYGCAFAKFKKCAYDTPKLWLCVQVKRSLGSRIVVSDTRHTYHCVRHTSHITPWVSYTVSDTRHSLGPVPLCQTYVTRTIVSDTRHTSLLWSCTIVSDTRHTSFLGSYTVVSDTRHSLGLVPLCQTCHTSLL